MINYYQPYLLPFLKPIPTGISPGIRRTYFLSFEDALWVLLRRRNIPKGARILLPDFYCIDVVNNIKMHGYDPVFYPLDDHFRISSEKLHSYIKRNKPAVTIIFHACGIASITQETLSSVSALSPRMLIIEDAVQRLIHPGHISLLHRNHYMIDSLRKVTPLPGSFIYQHKDSPIIRPDTPLTEWWYPLRVHLQYLLFRGIFIAAHIVKSAPLIRYAHERILSAHDDVVGDSKGGYAGFFLVPIFHRFINFQKTYRLKEKQTELYMKHLGTYLNTTSDWYAIDIPENQRKEMHVFPIGVRMTAGSYKTIEKQLHRHGIISWFKFPDCPWSSSRLVLYLPLGFHITPKNISYTARVIRTLMK